MKTSGPAIFFDGVTSARQDGDGRARRDRRCASALPPASCWPSGAMASSASSAAPDGVLRLGRAKKSGRRPARDPRRRSRGRLRRRARRRQARRRDRAAAPASRWSAGASRPWRRPLLVAMFGVPAVVSRVAPLVPVRVEQRLGASVDQQVRAMLDPAGTTAVRVRPGTDRGRAGRAAPRSTSWCTDSRQPPPCRFPLRDAVVRRAEANAIALPGGRVYVFEGLIDKAENARRAGRRHRARDGPHRPPRRRAGGHAGGRAVVPVRHADRRLQRRRGRGDSDANGAAILLFARDRSGGRRLSARP